MYNNLVVNYGIRMHEFNSHEFMCRRVCSQYEASQVCTATVCTHTHTCAAVKILTPKNSEQSQKNPKFRFRVQPHISAPIDNAPGGQAMSQEEERRERCGMRDVGMRTPESSRVWWSLLAVKGPKNPIQGGVR